jgi:hypothetical protein
MIATTLIRLCLASAIVVGALGGYCLVDVLVLAPLRSNEALLASLGEELNAVNLRRDAVERELAVARAGAAGDVDALLFASPAGPATAARLQELARDLVAEVGGVLVSSQAGNDDPVADGIVRVQVLVRARLTEEALIRLFAAVEASSPPMTFKAFEVAPNGGPVDQPPLDFTGVLTAFHSDAG